jgi:membrane associated rhomboid family serine protease
MFFPLHDNIPAKRLALVTYVLMTINVLAFVWVSRLPSLPQEVWAYQHGFVPARIAQLGHPQPIFVPVNVLVHEPFRGDYYQRRALELAPDPKQIAASLLTCMFLHASWLHLLTNMWFLWLFANAVEGRLGPVPFLFLYLFCGVMASLTHWAIAPNSITPVIGASGAIAGVLGAYAVTWPLARISTFIFLVVFFTVIDIPAIIVLGVWFAVQVIAGQAALGHSWVGGVAWWSHVGGFMAGMAIMPLLSLLFARKAGGEGTLCQAAPVADLPLPLVGS